MSKDTILMQFKDIIGRKDIKSLKNIFNILPHIIFEYIPKIIELYNDHSISSLKCLKYLMKIYNCFNIFLSCIKNKDIYQNVDILRIIYQYTVFRKLKIHSIHENLFGCKYELMEWLKTNGWKINYHRIPVHEMIHSDAYYDEYFPNWIIGK